VWSNGKARVILYRPYPQQFEDTLTEIPRVDQTINDVLEEKKTLEKLTSDYDLTERIKILEELVLANAGVDVFKKFLSLSMRNFMMKKKQNLDQIMRYIFVSQKIRSLPLILSIVYLKIQ